MQDNEVVLNLMRLQALHGEDPLYPGECVTCGDDAFEGESACGDPDCCVSRITHVYPCRTRRLIDNTLRFLGKG